MKKLPKLHAVWGEGVIWAMPRRKGVSFSWKSTPYTGILLLLSEFSTYYDWAKYFLEAGSGTSEAPGIGQPEMELYFAKYSKLKTVLGGIMNKS